MKNQSKFSKNNILIAIRSRPLSNLELETSSEKTITITSSNIIKITNPSNINKKSIFTFDFTFDSDSSQKEIYENTTKPLIKKVLEGYNATVFAYGATGSGKTYTMVGNGENPGIMIRSINDLFNELNNINKLYNVEISYVEIYNEQLKDLLDYNNDKFVDIRYDNNKGICLIGANFIKVNCANDAFKLLVTGNKNRSESSNYLNENSSRSHAILQINIKCEDNDNLNYFNKITFGKFILVDLAGSEKININTKGNLESGSINKSLLALGKCINNLISNNRNNFIPWRDSKLTRILQDSLSGNCRIVMIANISPSVISYEETLHTLQYANRAKNIKVNLKQNFMESNNFKIDKYDEIIHNLKEEIDLVRNEINEKEKFYENINENNKIKNDKEIDDKMEKDLIRHFQEEVKIKKEIIEKERNIESLKMENAENELKINSNTTINVSLIKQLIDSNEMKIKNIKSDLSNNYIHQSNLIEMRKNYQKKINELIENDNDSNTTNNLISIYKYYISFLENMNSEHRKYLNISELKRKDIKIKILTEQLDLRDKYIYNAGQEISNNNGDFNYNNPGFQTADEIDLNPYKPKIINVISNMNNTPRLNKSPSLFKKDNDNNVSTFYSANNNNNKMNIESFKNNDFTSIQNRITKFRQFNNEIGILRNKNNNSYLQKFQRDKVLRNNLSHNLINNGTNAINLNSNKGINLKLNKPVISSYDSRNSFYGDRYNINNKSNEVENNIIISNTSRLENEVEKKVKTILARNIIGRYKRSPYIQNLN